MDSSLAWGVIAGLVIGKPLGIITMSGLTVKIGWGDLPKNVGMSHLLGIIWLLAIPKYKAGKT